MIWQNRRRTLDLSVRGVIMGILNVTPDSFSDGGAHAGPEAAAEHALAMLGDGAAIIDIGGESTRPGAVPVPLDEELRRVLPVIRRLAQQAPDCLISIDTSKAAVALAALEAGAAIVNDVTALTGDPAMAGVIAKSGAGVVLMHCQGTPPTMQNAPAYADVTQEVRIFLEQRLVAAIAAGIAPECIALDPGIGFGKSAAHNLTLLRDLAALQTADRPLLVGVSRKQFLAKAAGVENMADRLWPTLAISALAREKGARILRVHEVRPNLASMRMAEALAVPD
jgi:dihydropteroate synthase